MAGPQLRGQMGRGVKFVKNVLEVNEYAKLNTYNDRLAPKCKLGTIQYYICSEEDNLREWRASHFGEPSLIQPNWLLHLWWIRVSWPGEY